MNQRNAYLIQILEKIGTPIVSAVLAEGNKQATDDAQNVAILLAKTVQLSIDLGNMVEIEKSSPNEIESLRVAMAALAGPMIASQYRQQAKIPGDADLKKLTGALEAVMTFSDNFTPATEHVIRLENMTANALPVDPYQTNIQYIQAFVPVADAIAAFPFGQSERKMVMDVADRITTRARQIRADIFGGEQDEAEQKLCELALVKSLADIYTQCHKTEMDRLTALQEPGDNAQQQALDALWAGFDTRAEMLGALAGHIVPAPQKVAPTPMPASPPVSSTATAATATQQAQTAPQSAASAPPPVQPQTQTAAPTNNPMSMFAAKPQNASDAQAQTPSQQAAPSQAQPPQMPQETPQTAAPVTPPQTPPQADQTSGQPGGNPMSFFKTPPKDDDSQ